MAVQTVDILGVPFSTMTMDETITIFKRTTRSGANSYVSGSNSKP